jgi:excisionase family DNA binding protein
MPTTRTAQEQQYLSVQEIADQLEIEPKTLRNWIGAGLFPRADLVVGQRFFRWRAETLDAWLRKGQHQKE